MVRVAKVLLRIVSCYLAIVECLLATLTHIHNVRAVVFPRL